ncbi:MAG: hypothetical protein CME35_12675 [Gramella sp.]|nr:hypothetical protein [Christiangramia sp.]
MKTFSSSFLKVMVLLIIFINASCGNNQNKKEDMNKEKNYQKGTFGFDKEFLQEKDTSLVVLSNGKSSVLVSPKYQAKVFTSTAEGLEGKSFGWINYEVFDKEKDEHMNAYGGENRFWLGPEGSKYSLFFKPKTKMVYDNWKTPAAIDTEAWKVVEKSSNEVAMKMSTEIVNYAGTELHLTANRSIRILSEKEISTLLDIKLDSIQSVGFSTENSITNSGEEAWTKETGAPCIWMLDMFSPSPETVIIVPFEDKTEGKIATTDYFGEIPKDRITYKNSTIFFKADGKSRGKLGVPPNRAKDKSGSYDPKSQTLTITYYDLDKDAVYLNQEWTDTKDPYKGDAVNAYNDGPLEDGSQMGPFYEIESVSPAAFLEPGKSLQHNHSVFHFTGNKSQLDSISKKLLNVHLEDIQQVF